MIHLLAHKIDIYHLCKYPGRAIIDFCLHIVEIYDLIFHFEYCALSGSETICKWKDKFFSKEE